MNRIPDLDQMAYAIVDEALKSYPLAEAPDSLLPAVLARIQSTPTVLQLSHQVGQTQVGNDRVLFVDDDINRRSDQGRRGDIEDFVEDRVNCG